MENCKRLNHKETFDLLEQLGISTSPPPEYHCDLYLQNVKGLDFSGAFFSYLRIKGNFIGAKLQYADFVSAKISGVSFQDADLYMANFSKSDISVGYFVNVKCAGANFSNCNLEGAIFHETDLRAANFNEAILREAYSSHEKWSGNRRDPRRAYRNRLKFKNVDLRGATFHKADLSGILIENCNCENADFSQANLNKTLFYECDLRSAKFNTCDLNNTRFMNIRHYDSKFSTIKNANLEAIPLIGVNLSGINLNGANLNRANLQKANLSGSDLRNANLTGANLSEADLSGSQLIGATLEEAILRDANLKDANLDNASLISCSLVGANLDGANLSNCEVYGISTWDIKITDRTIMKDLIISKTDQPLMTIDDIEVAQFLYTILDNRKISQVIDTMRTRCVLILGSFDDASKVTLNLLKNVIRINGHIPMIFNFEPPRNQELMETVRTMALLSNFVIVDLSNRSGQLHELANLVKDTFVPFVTIAKSGTVITAMHGEFKHYYWYRQEYFAFSKDEEFPQLFKEQIIPWVEQTNRKIIGKK